DEGLAGGSRRSLQDVALLLQLVGSPLPEALEILGIRLAEAAEAERAELRGAVGAAAAPDGRNRVELAETGPALGRVLSRHTRSCRMSVPPWRQAGKADPGLTNIGPGWRICNKRKDLSTNGFLTDPHRCARV